MKVLAVTAVDHAFFPFALGTIASLRANMPAGGLDIGILDIGLNPAERAELARQVEHIIEPAWAIDFPGQDTASNALRALVARPFLRELFPSYEIYFWIDADAWIQDRHAVNTYVVAAASSRGLVITPEISRFYPTHYRDPLTLRQSELEIYTLGWGEDQGRQMARCPLANAGVFALHCDSAAWGIWEEIMRMLLQRSTNFYVEQTALNAGILTGRIDIVPLPAHYNWLCHMAPPHYDMADGEWIEPGFPRQKLAVVHMTGHSKFHLLEASTAHGDKILTGLQYPHVAHYLGSEDYVSPGLKAINLAPCFPYMTRGNLGNNPWRYLRREFSHPWYVDRREQTIGFLNCDEAHILYNSALKVAGKRALEIGCFLGWSTCHIAAAGVRLDVIDPLLARQEFRNSVEMSLGLAGLLKEVNLIGAASPDAVNALAPARGDGWSLIYIDGDHEEPGPYLDAVACEPLCAADALVLFHDLAAPAVARGLDYFRQRGWNTMIYHTCQIMGVAWRGAIEPVQHTPDPRETWTLPAHLHPYS